MNTNGTIRVDGGIIMWSLTEYTYLQPMRDGLSKLGYDKFLPEQRSLGASLKDALLEVCGGARSIIRPLKSDKGTDGFMVLKEKRDTEQNEYSQDLIAKITPDCRIKLRPFDERAATIQESFNKQLGLIKPGVVATALVSVIESLGGTALRPRGAVYWMPGYNLEPWLKVAALVESCGFVGANTLFLIRHSFDDDSVRAIHAAIVNEISSEVTRIDNEIQNEDLGERALDTRKQQATAMHAKITSYEKILAKTLDNLHQAVDGAEAAIAKANILATSVPAGA